MLAWTQSQEDMTNPKRAFPANNIASLAQTLLFDGDVGSGCLWPSVINASLKRTEDTIAQVESECVGIRNNGDVSELIASTTSGEGVN